MTIDVPRSPAIYCRLSYAPDGSIEKVERQEADSRAMGSRLGWPEVLPQHTYRDNNRSAWQRNRRRPAWDRMLADLDRSPDQGGIDGIIVYHGDRLIRQPWDLEMLLRLSDERHVPLASVSGVRDLNSEDDRFVLRIEAAQACRESAAISRRVRRGWEARAHAGRPVGGGRRPFGFEPDMTTRRESEAMILAEAVDRLLAGQSQAGVLRWMSEVSTTSLGNRWSSRSLRNLLLAPRIAGLIEHKGELYKAVWEPIITREQWEDVRLLLAQSALDHPYPGRERLYLLSGVAECSTCQGTLRTKPSGGRNRPTARLYHCKNPQCTGRVSRSVPHLDAYVSGRVLMLLNDPKFIASLHADADTGQPGIAAEIAALERRQREARETFKQLVDHPEVDPGLLATSLAGFTRRIAELRQSRMASTRQRLLQRMAGITKEQWDSEPVDVRAETVRALYRVIVLPTTRRGPGFDVDAVRMVRVAADQAEG